MIIVKIFGGLGNQMFQYALGKSLVAHYKTELKLDVSGFTATKGDPKLGVRIFSLSNFNITASVASAAELAPYKRPIDKVLKKLARLRRSRPSYYNRRLVLEPEAQHYRFDERLFTRTRAGDFYCEGFFQSPKYFSTVEAELRQEFSLPPVADEMNARLISEMAGEQSVALHIRHGDNATSVAPGHGVLSLAYYDEALRLLAERVRGPLHVYVFSDDIPWARNNLVISHPVTFVDHNGDDKNYEDMRLMAACAHHIVGNSTFSWWGAWLGKKPGQQVFAPKYYHVGRDISGTDFYPSEWTVL